MRKADILFALVIDTDNGIKEIKSENYTKEKYDIIGAKGLILEDLSLVDIPVGKDMSKYVLNTSIMDLDNTYVEIRKTNELEIVNIERKNRDEVVAGVEYNSILVLYDTKGNPIIKGNSNLMTYKLCSCVLFSIDARDTTIHFTNGIEGIAYKYFQVYHNVLCEEIDVNMIYPLLKTDINGLYKMGSMYLVNSNMDKLILPSDCSYLIVDGYTTIDTLVCNKELECVILEYIVTSIKKYFISKDATLSLVCSIIYNEYQSRIATNVQKYENLSDTIRELVNSNNLVGFWELCRKEEYRAIIDESLAYTEIEVY